jgi:thymidine kinase
MTELFHNTHPNPGSIEVICGSMFSGKSEELIRRLRRAQIAKQRVQIFKPRLDNRFSEDHIVSHSDMKMKSELVTAAPQILTQLGAETQVVGIDEAQFFDLDLVAVCNQMADLGRRVIVAGLDQDYRARPFDPMPQLLAVAEYITKTLAICVRCGAPANRTQRLHSSAERVMIGGNGSYEARCRACFELPPGCDD